MHPIRAKIIALEVELSAAKLERDRLQREDKLPKAERSWKVFPENEKMTFSPIPQEKFPFFIVGTLTNFAAFDAHLERWGSIFNPPEEKIRSITYYLSILGEKGVVLSTNGGWKILLEDLVVDVEEWKKVRNSTLSLPSEWLRNGM